MGFALVMKAGLFLMPFPAYRCVMMEILKENCGLRNAYRSFLVLHAKSHDGRVQMLNK